MEPKVWEWLQNNYFSIAQPILKSNDGIYPLILAAQQGRSDIVNFLIKQHATLDVIDQYGNNALWAACYAENSECIAALLAAGVEINYQNLASGATALILAASSGRETVVEQLLAAGADPALKTQDDFTAGVLPLPEKYLIYYPNLLIQEIEMEALPRDLALRIALASRILPGIDISRLLEILHERVGSPLDDEKLKSVTVTNLKTGLGSLDGEEDGEDIGIGLANIKLAVRYLWGDEAEDEDLPEILTYRDGDMPDSIRVAIGSNSGALINGHFGSCIRFLVYQLSQDASKLVDIRSTLDADSSDDRNLFRANLIRDCHVMFVQSIGGPAAAKVIRADIYPIKIPDVTEAVNQLKEFQQVFAAPPPWFAKALGRSAEERVRFTHDEAC